MNDRKYYVAIILVSITLTILSANVPFFWDNILLISKIAHYYYENGCNNLILPTKLDSGHPPFYPLYLSVVWQLCGKSLWVSHLAILPFLIAIGVAYLKLAQLLLPRQAWAWALLFLCLEPAVLTQSVLGAIDMPLVAAHLWAVWALLKRNKWVAMAAMLLMCLVSLRGIITTALLGFTALIALDPIWRNSHKSMVALLTQRLKIVVGAIVSLAFMLVWYLYHYQQTGFLVHNPKSAWAIAPDGHHYDLVSFGKALWHIAVVFWRILDQGRVIWWLILGLCAAQLYRYYRQNKGTSHAIAPILANRHGIYFAQLVFIPLILYIGIIVVRNNPIMTRYFLSYFLLIQLLVLHLWHIALSTFAHNPTQALPHPIALLKAQKSLKIGLMVALLSGHAWIYPIPISNSWDTTLAALPYFHIQKQLFDYIDAQQIPYEQIGAAFPLFNAQKYIYLNNDTRYFVDKITVPFSQLPYIAYSNVCNEYTAQNRQNLAKNFVPEKKFECMGSQIILYKAKQLP